MGGGGGGAFSNRRTPEELRNLVRRTENRTTGAAFEAELGQTLNALLSNYNGRDTEAVQERLKEVKDALRDSIGGSFDQLFGGSVAKHTHVDGLSDIDTLVLINGSDLEEDGPQNVLDHIERALEGNLEDVVDVSHGRMAVTVNYSDGMVIQLLPAIRDKDGRVRVPSSRRDGWSEIDPLTFQQALTAIIHQVA